MTQAQQQELPPESAEVPVETLSTEVFATKPQRDRDHYFWFSSRPFFSTSLAVSWNNKASAQNSEAGSFDTSRVQDSPVSQADSWRSLRLRIFSPCGSLVNAIQVEIKSAKCSEIELESLVEGLAFQQGMRHGLLQVQAPEDVEVRCYGRNFSSSFLIEELSLLKGGNTGCFPLTAQDHSQHFLIVSNPSEEGIADARIRVMAGGRHKDIVCEIPARSSRIIGIESEFASLLAKAKASSSTYPASTQGSPSCHMNQVYVRISARGDVPIGTQMLEQQSRDERKPAYAFLSM